MTTGAETTHETVLGTDATVPLLPGAQACYEGRSGDPSRDWYRPIRGTLGRIEVEVRRETSLHDGDWTELKERIDRLGEGLSDARAEFDFERANWYHPASLQVVGWQRVEESEWAENLASIQADALEGTAQRRAERAAERAAKDAAAQRRAERAQLRRLRAKHPDV